MQIKGLTKDWRGKGVIVYIAEGYQDSGHLSMDYLGGKALCRTSIVE